MIFMRRGYGFRKRLFRRCTFSRRLLTGSLVMLFGASVLSGCGRTEAPQAGMQETEAPQTGTQETEAVSTDTKASKSGSDTGSSDTGSGAVTISEEEGKAPKEALQDTKDTNASVYELLDFTDTQEEEFARKGFLRAPDELVIRREDGMIAWTQEPYRHIIDTEAPDSVNPSLWRNAGLNSLYGLFEVTDGIYQVRGYDIANLTFVRSDHGWIVLDCTTSVETARAGLELLKEQFGEAHIAAVIVSHAHIDHFGGIEGIVSREELADASLPLEEQIASGKTLYIVPEGFEKAAIEENVFAGNAMKRRSNYQYGTFLPKGEKGSLSVGIGITPSSGTTSYLNPTFEVTEDIFEMSLDGVDMVFQLTPDTESPAEMNTYFPQHKALWMAENCTGTMHNLYTLRGAQIRDGNAWAQYILEAEAIFGGETEVVFQSHNWPHWGNEVVREYLINTASVYKYIFSQTLQYINEGYTETEIAAMISLPEALEKVWYTRQYYGTLAHNVKAMYQKYMGWYDGNPVHLAELEPTEYAKKLVEYLQDTDRVLEMAREDFEKGEYQWVAQITNTLVYAQPDHQEARLLCADALEQLGYQSESGAWRNAYLTAACELRNGTGGYPQANDIGSGATALGMSTETMLDYLGICMDAKKMEDENLLIHLEVTDEDARYTLRLNHGVLLYTRGEWSGEPDAVIRTKRAGILGIAKNNRRLMEACIESVSGNEDILSVLTGSLAEFPSYFNIVEP